MTAMTSTAASTTTSLPSSSSLLQSVPENLPLVQVAFDYEYDYKGRKITVKQGEKLYLLQRTNQHWWKCMRPGVNKAFFVPAQYVIVINEEDDGNNDMFKRPAGGSSNKKKVDSLQKSTSSVDSTNSGGELTSSTKPRKSSIFSTFERLKESTKSSTKPAVPSKSKSSISSRNEGSRSSHRVTGNTSNSTKEKSHYSNSKHQRDHNYDHHLSHHLERKSGSSSGSSSLRLKNWSASLEELSKQIVFPGLTSESVVDLTLLSTNNSFKPISSSSAKNNAGSKDNSQMQALSSHQNQSQRQRSSNESGSGRHGSCGSSSGSIGSCDGKFHTINKCLTFSNPTFANNNNEEKGSPTTSTNEESSRANNGRSFQMDSNTSLNKTETEMKSKDNSDGSFDGVVSGSGGLAKSGGEETPVPRGRPLRFLSDNWAEYFSPEKGRYFYYNSEEKKTSWKPPRSSSNRRSDECLASTGRSGASTIGSRSSIENSLDNLYEEINNSVDNVNSNSSRSGSIKGAQPGTRQLAKPDILQNQIPSSVGSSRKSVAAAVSTEELNSPEKFHNSGNSGIHDSSSSVFDSQENLDRPQSQQTCHDETPSEFSFPTIGTSIPIPQGWEECWDESIQQLYYVNKVTGAKWFTSTDPQGKIYFYEENSSQSSWFLPEVQAAASGGETLQEISVKVPKEEGGNLGSPSTSNSEEVLSSGTVKKRHSAGDAIDRTAKSKSLFLPDYRPGETTLSRFSNSNSLPRQPNISIWSVGHENNIIRDGCLGRTKITEGGKKVRKNWGVVFAVLTDSHLSLFKDQKSFGAHKSELEIELNGSTVEWTEEKSSRKNVFQLNTRYDLQMLFQSEDKNIAVDWFEDIKRISESYLPDISLRLRSPECPETFLDPPIGERKISRLYRNKSTKIKITPSDDMGADRKKITANLRKFFSRRPPRESLVKKGIYKDEPVFGCSLEKLCLLEKQTVPFFVQECILAIEQKEENLKTDGIYRASGNLSQVQKIRLQVDQNNFQCLYHEEDVHVLAGSLKLFFREMREPLISYDSFEKSFDAINSGKKDKVAKFRDIVKTLAKPNRDTLQALLRHLLKVAEYAEHNRMMIPNLAIVFGPTLMWPAIESKNMALDLMQQNYVIEALLVDFESIFAEK